MILENHDFFSLGLFRYFGVGGSIRLVKLVCLLLARASQASQKAKILKQGVQNLKFKFWGGLGGGGVGYKKIKNQKNRAPFLCIHGF